MKYIKKLWARLLISLLFGSAITEVIHIKTGSVSDAFVMPLAILCFVLLSALVWFDAHKYYFFPNLGSKDKENSDILDDDID